MAKLSKVLETLGAMPTLAQGHTANLKIDTGSVRFWVSRMGAEDGETRPIQVEVLKDGRWTDRPVSQAHAAMMAEWALRGR